MDIPDTRIQPEVETGDTMQLFLRFCSVGGVAFAVDSLCFLLFSLCSTELMVGRLLSFWVAAQVTWWGNRRYTFVLSAGISIYRQWCKAMCSVHFSGLLNLLTFWLCLPYLHVAIAFCLGVGVGLISNFLLSQLWVFKRAN